jgi:hypothetical protein
MLIFSGILNYIVWTLEQIGSMLDLVIFIPLETDSWARKKEWSGLTFCIFLMELWSFDCSGKYSGKHEHC